MHELFLHWRTLHGPSPLAWKRPFSLGNINAAGNPTLFFALVITYIYIFATSRTTPSPTTSISATRPTMLCEAPAAGARRFGIHNLDLRDQVVLLQSCSSTAWSTPRVLKGDTLAVSQGNEFCWAASASPPSPTSQVGIHNPDLRDHVQRAHTAAVAACSPSATTWSPAACWFASPTSSAPSLPRLLRRWGGRPVGLQPHLQSCPPPPSSTSRGLAGVTLVVTQGNQFSRAAPSSSPWSTSSPSGVLHVGRQLPSSTSSWRENMVPSAVVLSHNTYGDFDLVGGSEVDGTLPLAALADGLNMDGLQTAIMFYQGAAILYLKRRRCGSIVILGCLLPITMLEASPRGARPRSAVTRRLPVNGIIIVMMTESKFNRQRLWIGQLQVLRPLPETASSVLSPRPTIPPSQLSAHPLAPWTFFGAVFSPSSSRPTTPTTTASSAAGPTPPTTPSVFGCSMAKAKDHPGIHPPLV